MKIFANQLAKGENISPETASLAAYGIYLMHGGDPDRFEDLTVDDIQIIYTTHMALMRASTVEIVKGISELFKGKAE